MTDAKSVGTCVFCQKDLKDPVSLVCGHHICASCVDDAFMFAEVTESFVSMTKKRVKTEEEIKKEKKNALRCPLCNTQTSRDEVKPDHALRAMASYEAQLSEAADKKLVCGFCQKPATTMCVFCGPLCEEHSDFLHVNGPMHSHELEEIKNGKVVHAVLPESSEFSLQRMPLCYEHKKRCELLCQKCNVLICPHCMYLGAHKNHECVGINTFLKTVNTSIVNIVKDIREAIPSCKGLLDGFECLEKNADKEHKEIVDEVNKKFEELQEMLKKNRQDVLKEIENVYADFDSTVGQKKNALKTLHMKCEDFVSRVAAEDSLPESVIARYTLFHMLTELKEALVVVSSTNTPDEKSKICRALFDKKVFSGCFNPVSVTRVFRLGAGKRQVCDINLETLRASRSFSSPINALENSSHDGSAFFDPTRNAIFAVGGNVNNCQDVLITRLVDATHGETERRADVIPYPSHGQYPIFDGVRYAYFCESEGEDNNRFGRLDLDTFTFEELAHVPDGFREFNSGCCFQNRIYAVNENHSIMVFDPDANTWENAGIELHGESRLLADPLDECMFVLSEETRGLFQVDVAARSTTLLSNPPRGFDLNQNGEAVVAALPDRTRILFTCLNDRWFYYLFENNTWTQLEQWEEAHNGSAHLVIISESSVALYHVDGESVWRGVNLR